MKRVLLLLLLTAIASSCVKLSSFSVESTPSVKVKGITASGIYLELAGQVSNSGRRVSIKGFELDITDGGGNALARLSSDRELVIPSGDGQPLALIFKIAPSGGMLAGLKDLSSLNLDEIYLKGHITAKSIITKRIKVKEIPLKRYGNLFKSLDPKQ